MSINNKGIVAIILARMGSSRMPGKVLMKFNGIPALKHIFNRLQNSTKIDRIIVATSTNPENNAIEEFCDKENIACFRGDEEDVLDRFYKCASKEAKSGLNIGAVVRVTGDALFIDWEITDQMIQCLFDENLDYIHNRHASGPPWGFHAEVISFQALKKLNETVKDKEERQHVTLHILNNKNNFNIKLFDATEEFIRPNYRLILEQKEDYELITRIYKELGNMSTTSQVISFLDNNPEIASINKNLTIDHATTLLGK